MEVANELKRLSSDVNTVLLYDEAEEMEKMMNSLKAEGANNEKKSIAKSMLDKKMDIPLISELTGLSEKQIAKLM